MNILIVGEYSSFAKHLKNGFKKLGHNVTIIMRPDAFKRLKGEEDDIVYGSNLYFRNKPIRGTALLLSPIRAVLLRLKLNRRFKNVTPDLIIVINYEFLTNSPFALGTPLSLIDSFVKKGAKLIMSVCGLDPSYYYLYPDYYRIARVKAMKDDEKYSYLINNADAIIPTGFSYYSSITKYCEDKGFKNARIKHAIPLPITVDKKCDISSCVGRKIVIFHGIIRPAAKGTPIIQEAMNRIQAEMPDKVECICRGNMPYHEYVNVFNNLDILIDQTYENAWGINAEIGAMKGKCVLSSCGKENADNMGLTSIPFVRIRPDSEQIYRTLRELVLNPQKVDSIKKESRRFIEDNCDCKIVAQRYLESVELK